MKKTVRFALTLSLVLAILTSGFVAAHAAEARYTGIYYMYSSLTVSSSGKATCTGKVTLRDGYTADLTVELKQDGNVIKTWTASGSEDVSGGGSYYVTKGHEYVATTSAKVYDANNKLIESPSKDSQISKY